MHSIHHLDEIIAGQIEKIPVSFGSVLKLCTSFGSLMVIGPLALITAYLLWPLQTSIPDVYSTRIQYSGALVVVLLPLASIIKALTRRQRPDTIYVRKMRFKHFSFPSGHSYTSLLVYGFLAYLAASWPIYIAAAILIFLIGLSRVYIGAHFPSDVIGGWLLAAIVLAVVITYANQAVV